jgi:magnesium transporter
MRISLLTYEGTRRLLEEGEVAEARRDLSGPVWVDVHHPTPKGMARIQEAFNLHPLAVEDTLNQNQRPKIEEYPDHLFVIINSLGLAGSDLEFNELDIFLGRDYILTVHTKCYTKMEAAYQRLNKSGHRTSFTPDYLLYLVIDTVIDAYFPVLDQFDREVEMLNERAFENPSKGVLKRIFQLKSAMNEAWRVLGYERDILNIMSRYEQRLFTDPEVPQLYLRDIYDHVLLLADITNGIRDELNTVTELYISGTSNRLNAVVNRLSIITIVIGVLTVISGFYGMNFASTWPPFSTEGGVIYVLMLMVVLPATLLYILKRLKVF